MSNESQDNLEERIAAYIDGELLPAEAARLEVYLANTDAKLAESVINMIGDRHRLKSLPKESAPDDLAARIMEQVERTSLLYNVDQLAPTRRAWWQSRAAAAALLFLVLGAFTTYMFHALQPASPAWQAALETNPGSHLPTIAAGPAGPLLPASTAPFHSTIAQIAQLDVLKKRELEEKAASAALTAAEPASANGALAVAGAERLDTDHTTPAPVVLAFVARDAADFVRLQSIIEAATPPSPPPSALASSATRNMRAEDQLAQQNAPLPTGAGGTMAGGGSGAPADSNTAAAAPPSDQARQYQNPAQNSSQNQAAGNRNDLYRNQSNFGMASADAAAQKDLQAPAVTAAPSMPVPSADNALKPAPQLPVTYHVALRASDIDTLTHQFQPATKESTMMRDKTAPPGNRAAADLYRRAPATSAAAPDDAPLPAPDPRIDCVITMTPPPPASQPTTTAP